MKQKHLEIKLQQYVRPFTTPKIDLEQFHTPPDICATVVHSMYLNGEIEGLQILDLGCGTGFF
jgi:putative methylase